MAKAKHTYAIRLSVDGGGKVKAELMDVGRAGDKSLKKIEKAGGKASLGLTKLSDRAQALGRNMKFLYGAIAAAGAIRGLQEMVKLYADFEAGLIGVGKTANLSKTELASLGQDIDALSKRIPVATDELLAIAQSAGQLGVKGAANILKFTETVAKLGTATDLSGNDAAMALARILNVTGETMDTVDVLGSVIVALGNNFAATESQITEMTTEVARATSVFGVSSAQASALAAALASVGVKSEVAGTSVGRVMHMMDAAVRSGGKHLDILSKITGQTGAQIKTLFAQDSTAAFVLFIEGLKRISDAGGSAAEAMAALGLSDQRLLKTLPVLANRADLLATALDLASRETENATALNEEAAKAFESLNSQTELMWNNIKSLARSIGEDLAPGVTTAVKELGSLANQASVAYEQLKLLAQGDFNLEGLSLGSTRSIVEERRAELQEIARELKELGDVEFLDDPLGWGRKVALERQLKEKAAIYRQWSTKLAWMQRDMGGKPDPKTNTPTPDDTVEIDLKAAQVRADRITKLEKDLQRQLFTLTHQGAERIRAEYEQLAKDVEALLAPDGSNQSQVDALMDQAASVRDAKLARLAAKAQEAANRITEANRKVIDGLRAEHDALAMTDKQRFVSQALRRLSAEATDVQQRQVRELAGALFEEQQAIEARNKAEEDAIKLREKGKSLTISLRTAQESYKAEIADLNKLLAEGAIAQETFARASEQAYERMLNASQDWSAGVSRALRDYGKQAGDAAQMFEDVTSSALKASEDAWVNWARTGKLSVGDFFTSLEEAALRAAYRLLIFKPMESFLEGLIGSFSFDFSSSSGLTAFNNGVGLAPQFRSTAFAHSGGMIGVTPLAHRPVDPAVFNNAPRFHSGGLVGGEVPVIAKKGEVIGWPGQMREAFGSEVVVQVIDQRGTQSASIETSSTRGPSGEELIRILVRDAVEQEFDSGGADRMMKRNYAASRAGIRRE
ncbi:MAG: phage tail tape measure protein [Alphaproteobacteria bacterium]|jgi:TP901 family phage tail tape measure protein/lambda family phage tail tape measure protein|nr:phage tail tape measure protein [Alphaproteobacteria bacterium]MBT6406735.1 phage tail tape measure protein [Rhodospirillaceae bacterium]